MFLNANIFFKFIIKFLYFVAQYIGKQIERYSGFIRRVILF